MAVVDANFRVHRTKALRIVDASVFPRIPGFFIVTPVYMIAEKASDAILADAEARHDLRRIEGPSAEIVAHLVAGRQQALVWGSVGAVALVALLVLIVSSVITSSHSAGNRGTAFLAAGPDLLLSQAAFPFVLILLALDLLLSLVHAFQELKGRMWRYVGAIAGLGSGSWGIAPFFFALTAVLWTVGLIAIVGYPFAGDSVTGDAIRMAAVGALIGLRLSDRWHLHIKLDRLGYRPNPGLPSVPYYFAEAAVLAVLFLKGVVADWPLPALGAGLGVLFGWLFFYTVLPIARAIARFVPGLRQKPWRPRRPMASVSDRKSRRQGSAAAAE